MKLSRIMLIDDNEGDQYLACDAIEEFSEHIEVIQAYDGQEALGMLSSLTAQPDVIFLDINMPGMCGFEFLREYTAQTSTPSAIIMLSSSEQQRDRERGSAYTCVKHYMGKPLNMESIAQVEGLL